VHITFTDTERQVLLRLARTAIARAIGVESSPSAGDYGAPTLTVHAGAFVSLHIGPELRGGIGYLAADKPLVHTVERCAASAALSDPRFPSLTAADWPRISIEISVLGPMEPIADIAEIEVGRHGLFAAQGACRGLLLPQVAVEWNWTCEQFVEQTCRKAGLPKDAWRMGAALYKFEADVFSDLPDDTKAHGT